MKAILCSVGSAFLAVALSAAQGEKPAPALAEGPNPCALQSRLEVAEASGVPIAEGVTQLRIGSVTGCSFAGERGGRVVLLIRRAPAGDWVAEQVARMNRGIQLGTYREVPGIGERSFLYAIRGGAALCVFEAGHYLQVSLFGVGEDSQVTAALEKLATSTLARLRLAASDGIAHSDGRPGSPPAGSLPESTAKKNGAVNQTASVSRQ